MKNIIVLVLLLVWSFPANSLTESSMAWKLQTPGQKFTQVKMGRALWLPKPDYPMQARLARASGEVKIKVVIDSTGRVTQARPIAGHRLLQRACVKAARKSRFSPTIADGQPVKATGVILYRFMHN